MSFKQTIAVFSAATDSGHKIIQKLQGKGQSKFWTILSSLGQEPTFKVDIGMHTCFKKCTASELWITCLQINFP